MAFRLYTREEFERELRETLGLRCIGPENATMERWMTTGGRLLLIRILPDGEMYPHFMVGSIANQVRLLDAQ